ncbi:MAG TPA: 23S rRNA (adenine(2503)-C(2))-methyltransferase RlmN, partial [Pirellulales bacterium]|nr:23S rRNA (adenine(2503)-C(2))-methyltransferase RlmN [Pirellulales bacterium]
MKHILEPDPQALAAWFAERGAPAYRAGQVRRWLFERRAESFDEMTDLPK